MQVLKRFFHCHAQRPAFFLLQLRFHFFPMFRISLSIRCHGCHWSATNVRLNNCYIPDSNSLSSHARFRAGLWEGWKCRQATL